MILSALLRETRWPAFCSPFCERSMMSRMLLLILAMWALSPVSAQTVVLVRHAEKMPEPKDDPSLSEAGRQRAEALAEALKGARVSAILTTTYKRTRETAAPLARLTGVEPQALTIARGGMADHVADVVQRVRAKPGGMTVVVGHSNTVTAIARALGVAAAEMPECEYSRMTLVQLADPPRVITSRYGIPDGACL